MYQVGILKIAASRLREGIRVERDGAIPSYWNIIHQDRLSNAPRMVGSIDVGPGGGVTAAVISPEYQGMGIARKAYGEVARRQPGGTLFSDKTQTPGSFSAWNGASLQRQRDVANGKRGGFMVWPHNSGTRFSNGLYRSNAESAGVWAGVMPPAAWVDQTRSAPGYDYREEVTRRLSKVRDQYMGHKAPVGDLRVTGATTPPGRGRLLSEWESELPQQNANWQMSNAALPGNGTRIGHAPIVATAPVNRRSSFANWSRTLAPAGEHVAPGLLSRATGAVRGAVIGALT